MSSIFTPCELGVLRVNTEACAKGKYATISVDKFADADNFEVPIVGFTLDLGTNHQFLHALDEFIYVYAFGDRIGELVITGIAFIGPMCDDLEEAQTPTSIINYYNNNKISHGDGPTVAKIAVHASPTSPVFLGFLTGMRLDMPNPALPIVQWALRYSVVVSEEKYGTGFTA